MYGYHTDTLYELRPTSCTDVLRRCVRIAPTYAVITQQIMEKWIKEWGEK